MLCDVNVLLALVTDRHAAHSSPEGHSFHLYHHQVEALKKACQGESYVVTSGIGSGKSLTYFLPIINDLVQRPPAAERVAALVVYPMNALVNSQLQAMETLRGGYERHTGQPFPVTFAKFTGETSDTAREALRQPPPQILPTNYVMAELLLVRPEYQPAGNVTSRYSLARVAAT